MINECGWAQNRSKLERAINEVKGTGKEVTEEAVKIVYKRLKGFVIGEDVRIPLSKEVEGLSSEELFLLARNKKADEDKLKPKKEKEEEEEEKPKKKSKK